MSDYIPNWTLSDPESDQNHALRSVRTIIGRNANGLKKGLKLVAVVCGCLMAYNGVALMMPEERKSLRMMDELAAPVQKHVFNQDPEKRRLASSEAKCPDEAGDKIAIAMANASRDVKGGRVRYIRNNGKGKMSIVDMWHTDPDELEYGESEWMVSRTTNFEVGNEAEAHQCLMDVVTHTWSSTKDQRVMDRAASPLIYYRAVGPFKGGGAQGYSYQEQIHVRFPSVKPDEKGPSGLPIELDEGY